MKETFAAGESQLKYIFRIRDEQSDIGSLSNETVCMKHCIMCFCYRSKMKRTLVSCFKSFKRKFFETHFFETYQSF